MFKWLYKKKGCAKHLNNKLEVIGIDHGWSMMKTISQVFVTGVKEITTTPALFGDVLEYEGKFYKVGTVRQEVKDTKVEDDSFYLLTLAAVAKELKRRGLAEAKVFLAVGLPLTRFGAEKNDFIKYLTKNKRVSFKYENESYHIEIDDVAVFPQCYAAVVDKIPAMAMNMLMALMILSMIFVMVSMSAASARRISEVLNEKADLANPEKPYEEVEDGRIDFNHVNFSYRKNSTEDTLHDIDIHINAGETIGIIGGTGCGKSSFVSLISRLYDVTEGSVCVGGKDVRTYDMDALRNQVAVVLQKNVLFSGTILDNLRWGDDNASYEDCVEACKQACADEFIERICYYGCNYAFCDIKAFRCIWQIFH